MAVEFKEFDSAPRDGSYFEAWHRVHECWITVRLHETLDFEEKTLTTRWPECAFTFWRKCTVAKALE